MFYNIYNLRTANYISLDQIPTLIYQKQLLIDLRSTNQFNDSHIDGFINIPYSVFEQYINRLPHQPIYLLCQNGKLSATLSDQLNEMGITSYSFIGGYAHYKQKPEQYF